MNPSIDVVLRKEDVTPEKVIGRVAVVFDVLLATTTLTYALDRGIRRVRAVLDAQAARQALTQARGRCLVAGESGGQTIAGFLPMDPREWPWSPLAEEVVLTSTNGTIALNLAQSAAEVLAGGLVNGSALARRLARFRDVDVVMICSGSRGLFSLEDFLGAGLVIDRMTSLGTWALSDSAMAARATYRQHRDELASVLANSRVGRWIRRQGWDDVIALASAVDSAKAVPVRRDQWFVDERA